MASEVPYEVICASTGVQLTEWSQMAVIHDYSAKEGRSRPYFLHISKDDKKAKEQLDIISAAHDMLWELQDASPTSLKSKENAEKQLAMANASVSYENSEILDELDAIENDSDYDGNVVE